MLKLVLNVKLILLISTMVNGTLLNFGKRYKDDLRLISDQWPKLHLGLDALSNQKILNGVYYGGFHLHLLVFPFVYQFNSRLEALVCSSFAND